jgi:hypothetical protein
MTLPNTQPILSQTTTTPASQAKRTAAATSTKEALISVALQPQVSQVNMLTIGTTGALRGLQAMPQTTSLKATVATSTTTSTTNSSKAQVNAPTATTSHPEMENSFDQMTEQVQDKTEEGANLAQASDLSSMLKTSAPPPNGKRQKRSGSRIHSTDTRSNRHNNRINQITCSDTRIDYE